LHQHLPKEQQGKIVHDLRQQQQLPKEQVEQETQQRKQGWTEHGKVEGNIGIPQN
jgi:hypothetical protein